MSTNGKVSLMAVIQQTPPAQIADLDVVRDRYIQNYNACHREKIGDLMYHRNVIHFKQYVAGSKQLAQCDPFSLYAVFATAAVNGYSLDPNDNEVYVIARGGKACLDRQAGAYVRRLMRTQQAEYFDQPKLVYSGDIFQVENGRVIRHVENFQTDIIIAGYVRVIIGDGGDRFFIYRKSDFDSWRKKSPNPATVEKKDREGRPYISESLWDNGVIDGTQPEPNFLRTKIVKHAAKEKCWATGSTPAQVEVYADVEIDSEDLPQIPLTDHQPVIPQQAESYVPAEVVNAVPAEHQNQNNGKHFAPAQPAAATITVDNDDDDDVF